MACNVINSWTLSGLVGAFVDLSIAYLLLCGSSVAYLASKFLGLFGKSLPCPCNGMLGHPHNCFQSTLVNKPHLKISTVQSCVMEKLPFDSICNKFYGEEFGSKKKSIRANKACFRRFGLRRRKRLVAIDTEALSFSNHTSTTPIGFSASITTPNESEDAWETSEEIGLLKPRSQDFELGVDPCIDSKIDKELALADDIECSTVDCSFDCSEKNEIGDLEQGLAAKHDARTALYLELEKERTAAATAADEAMAMILRLQEEKATIEMEARQYQRMIEEKFAYDAEEMNILKEILLRREREKHFLEKQVEAYKQMFCEKEVSDMDMYDLEAIHEQRTSNAEQHVMSPQIAESVGEKEMKILDVDLSEYRFASVGSPNHPLDFGKAFPVPELNEDAASLNYSIEKKYGKPSRNFYEITQEFELKGMTSENENSDQENYVQSNLSTTPLRSGLHEKAINTIEEEEQSRETGPLHCLTPKATEAKIIFPYNNEKMEKHGEDSHGFGSGTDYHLLDVHVINDESDMPRTCDNQTIGGLDIECYRKSNSLDRSSELPPFGPSRVKSLPPISRRNSMSAFDYERLKIDNEVGWLRERLKIIQKGRDKLNFRAEHKEKEHIQLQILENIASQLREIRQLTEPRKQKALRRASLPHQSSKVIQGKDEVTYAT